MHRFFIDAAFLIALLQEDDEHHAQAVRLGDELSARRRVMFVTTHLVFAEVLAYVSRGGPRIRAAAILQVAELAGRSDCEILPLTEELFARGINLYSSRPDQRYSLTDCVSMEICRDLNITEVLTSDTDFEHEGFHILLADD